MLFREFVTLTRLTLCYYNNLIKIDPGGQCIAACLQQINYYTGNLILGGIPLSVVSNYREIPRSAVCI